MIWDEYREDWDPMAPTGELTPIDPADRTEFVVHWWGSALPDLTDHDACHTLMRSTQNYHQNTRGWVDIGYNGAICAHGLAIEGRGIDVQGAHAYAHNVTGYGICFMTPLDSVPTDAMYERMRVLVDALEGHSDHSLRRVGHLDVGNTDCPGPDIEEWVRAGMPSPFPDEPSPPATKEDIDRLIASQTYIVGAVNSLVDAVQALTESQRLAGQTTTTAMVNLTGAVTASTGKVDTMLQNMITKNMALYWANTEQP